MSLNTYSLPIDETKIVKAEVRKDSPAHIIYHNKDGTITDLREAVDFRCSEGVKLFAAYDGKVHAMKTDVTRNYDGFTVPTEEQLPEEEQDGNYVVLSHGNGEFSIYSHFQFGGVNVAYGQDVKQGELLGYSGNTGWSIKPHLHFCVFNEIPKDEGKKDIVSLGITWDQNAQKFF